MITKLKNWFWFKFIIKGNEFHPKLDLNDQKLNKGGKFATKEIHRVNRLRNLANEMGLKKYGK